MTLKFFSATLVFKIIVTIIIFYSLVIWMPANNSISYESAITHWDTFSYQEVSKNGYILPANFPESIRLGAFYPGLPMIMFFGDIMNLPYLIYFLNFLLYCLFSFILYSFIVNKWYKAQLDESKSKFLFWSFCLFPFSAFLHFNYTEIYFLLGGIWALDLILSKKVWLSQIPALVIGFFQPTAFSFGLFAWILYTIEARKDKSNLLLKEYIFKSLGFLSYIIGSLCMYAYNAIKNGNWRLFFDSQYYFYGKNHNLGFIAQTWGEITGNVNMWYNNYAKFPEIIKEYGFWFYGREFNLIFLLWFPFAVAIIGSVMLIKQKKYYWLAYSWGLLIPALLFNTVSFNRYMLISFPLIFAFNELFYQNKLSRYFLYVTYSTLFVLTIVLFTHGFWVG